MKVFVKNLKGTSFEIHVDPRNSIFDVKKNIETVQGKSVYPAEQQLLIHQGKVLKDETTLHENHVSEGGFLVIMLSKAKGSSSGASTTKAAPANQASTPDSAPSREPIATPTPQPASARIPTVTASPAPPVDASSTGTYGEVASNLVAENNFEQSIQGILDMGGGTWDRDTVVHAFRAAYNNPERAVDYLYSGIPEHAEAPPVARALSVNPPAQTSEPVRPSIPFGGGPNADPLDLFPQGLLSMGSNTGAGSLDFLRDNPQFQTLQAMVRANPQILQPMLQELGKENPQIMGLIQEHEAEFLRLINEPVRGEDGDLLGQLEDDLSQTVEVTPAEAEAIERLEMMGIDHALALEAFFACNKNEELAANYLLDHMHEFED